MAASAEVGGVVDALRRVIRRVASTASQRPPGRAVLALAELTLTQMGVPGAVASCEYLCGWWGTAESGKQRIPPAPATPAPAMVPRGQRGALDDVGEPPDNAASLTRRASHRPTWRLPPSHVHATLDHHRFPVSTSDRAQTAGSAARGEGDVRSIWCPYCKKVTDHRLSLMSRGDLDEPSSRRSPHSEPATS